MAAVLHQLMAPYTFRLLQPDDMTQVMEIETSVYDYPWTARNFHDSREAGYRLWGMWSANAQLVGYAVFMLVLDEIHLLNLSIRREWQGQGMGAQLLKKILDEARAIPVASILLEVRPSNTAAIRLYRQFEFRDLGVRKNYYPAGWGRREDALVMRCWLFPHEASDTP